MSSLVQKWFGPGLRSLLIPLFISFLALQVDAQTNKEYILQNTDVKALNEMAIRFAEEYQREHAKAVEIAKEKGWPLEGLIRIDEKGLPIYYGTTNADASAMTNTTSLRADFGVYGAGMFIGEWDGGHARFSHQDLIGRVTNWDGPYNPQSHGTHVAGTLVGSGIGDPDARGMAPQAVLRTYDWNNDQSEMTTAAISGMLISNHSYGARSGWKREDGTVCSGSASKWTWSGDSNQFNLSGNGEDAKFGQYNSTASQWDAICFAAPMYLPVKSAGNDQTDQPWDGSCSDDVRNGSSGTYVSYDENVHPSGDGTHASSISTYGNAKNILTVGNLQDDQLINGSSSRGQTDDGRIKPDICGNGTSVYSTEVSADNAYGDKTGTSMAAPNVAASLLLLQQLFEEKNGNNGTYMRSATLKGLAIHTASDLGNPGPDYTYGWGLLNAQKAGTVINRDSYELDHRIIEENNPIGYSFTFFKDGPIRVTLCYTDVAGSATSAHNDATPKLVNDLDLTVVKTGGSTHYPYVMNTGNPSANATTGDNDLDNVEQIYLTNATDGEYTVYVNVEGTLTGTQPFSLIISGVSDGCGGGDLDLGNNTVIPDVYYGDNVLCEGTVQNGAVVKFVAGSSVHLTESNGSGFHAVAGSNFRAVVLQCD